MSRADTIVLIDGLYRDTMPLRHREILELLEQQVRVIGAAGIGALRAAELHSFGMEGVGLVFRLYRAGALDGDDEVAVIHTSEQGQYVAHTEALVNVRYASHEAVKRGVLTQSERDALVRAGKQLPLNVRTWNNILEHATHDGLPEQACTQFKKILPRLANRLTHHDALAAVRRACSSNPTAQSPLQRLTHVTAQFDQTRALTKGSEVNGLFVSDPLVLALFQLHASDYPQLQREVAVDTFADWSEPVRRHQPDDVEVERFCSERGFGHVELDNWLHGLDLDRADLATELRHSRRRSAPGWRDYAEQALFTYFARYGIACGPPTPAGWRKWLRDEEQDAPAHVQITLIAARTFFVAPLYLHRSPLIRRLKFLGVFAEGRRLVGDARRFNARLRASQPSFTTLRLSETRMKEWYRNRWASTDFDRDLLDRGMPMPRQFFEAARRFYLFDKHVGIPHDLLPAPSGNSLTPKSVRNSISPGFGQRVHPGTVTTKRGDPSNS